MDHTEKLEMTKQAHVRIAGVCNCEIYEHCEKCDPEWFANRPVSTDLSKPNKFLVTLTPDDILTLRLLRDEFQRQRMAQNTSNIVRAEGDRLLDTLNRILKQVE